MKAMASIFFNIFLITIFSTEIVFSQYGGLSIDDIQSKGDEYFKYAKYHNAIEAYSELLERDMVDKDIHYHLGVSYLHIQNSNKALDHLVAAKILGFMSKNRPKIAQSDMAVHYSADLDFNLARAYHLEHKFEEAQYHYKLVLHKYRANYYFQKLRESDKQVVIRYIEMAENGAFHAQDPISHIAVENLGPHVNSAGEDYTPVLSPSDDNLFFTSDRTESTDGVLHRVFKTEKKGGLWSAPVEVYKHHRHQGHISCVGMDDEGNQLLVYKGKNYKSADLYIHKGDPHSGSVSQLSKSLNSRHIENSASIAEGGETIVFASDRPGGFGGMDLYLVKKKSDGTWGNSINMGPQVNTKFDEDAPHFHFKSGTLFFSSKGHDSMGGYDVFRTIFSSNENEWSQPENLGLPINSARDDIFFTVDSKGHSAYFSSHKHDTHGGKDLYTVRLVDEASTVQVDGNINSLLGDFGLKAQVQIIDVESGELMHTLNTQKDGSFTARLKIDTEYHVTVHSRDYVPADEFFIISANEVLWGKEINVSLDELSHGHVLDLDNVYFENNSHKLHLKSHRQLKIMAAFLNSHPTLVVEIAGHTEPGATPIFNYKLSQERADAVREYLIHRGIDEYRITSVGYGDEFPRSSNSSKTERKKDRRTEMVVRKDVDSLKIPFYDLK